MSGLAHPALCGLVGFCLYPPMIICEFASYGDLYTFLHQEKGFFLSPFCFFFSFSLTPSPPPTTIDAENEKYREMTFNLRMRMALDMAMGMRYLHTRDPPIIHRFNRWIIFIFSYKFHFSFFFFTIHQIIIK